MIKQGSSRLCFMCNWYLCFTVSFQNSPYAIFESEEDYVVILDIQEFYVLALILFLMLQGCQYQIDYRLLIAVVRG